MSEPKFELCLQTSVNRWECDENDHLNVRFFVRMAWESIDGWLQARSCRDGWRFAS